MFSIRKVYKMLGFTSDEPIPKSRQHEIKKKRRYPMADNPSQKSFAERLVSDELADQSTEDNSPEPSKKKERKEILTPAKKEKIKKIRKEEDLLRGALEDLEEEISSLRSVRSQMEKKIKSASRELGTTQRQELEMQNKINTLKSKENDLVKKTASTKEKLDAISQKIEKVKSIERQLKEM